MQHKKRNYIFSGFKNNKISEKKEKRIYDN